MAELSEKELLRRCKKRDERAFAQLVNRYKDMVFTLIDRMVYDKSILEDLAQEVFLRVYRGIAQFRGKSKLSTWIYRITYNVCLAEIGSAKSRADILQLGNRRKEGAQLELASNRHDLEDWVARLELKEAVGRLLEQLRPEYRMVIALYYLEGISYSEIAEVMRLPLGTVKTYLHRAKKCLRDMIVREGIEAWTARIA